MLFEYRQYLKIILFMAKKYDIICEKELVIKKWNP